MRKRKETHEGITTYNVGKTWRTRKRHGAHHVSRFAHFFTPYRTPDDGETTILTLNTYDTIVYSTSKMISRTLTVTYHNDRDDKSTTMYLPKTIEIETKRQPSNETRLKIIINNRLQWHTTTTYVNNNIILLWYYTQKRQLRRWRGTYDNIIFLSVWRESALIRRAAWRLPVDNAVRAC